jgi:hypothetical protein
MGFSTFRHAATALLAAALGGCSSLTTIDVRDDSVFIPSARLVVPLSTQQQAPSEAQNGHALELGYTQAKGSGSQSLSAGQDLIVFGGQRFNPPRELQYEFEYGHTELLYRFRRFFGSSAKFGIEALGGVVYSQLKLSASSPGLSASDRFNSGGISSGVGLIWKVRQTTTLQGRFSAFGTSETIGNRIEFFAAQALGRHAAIRGGYTWWRLRTDDEPDRLRSDIAVRFRGPALALDVMF